MRNPGGDGYCCLTGLRKSSEKPPENGTGNAAKENPAVRLPGITDCRHCAPSADWMSSSSMRRRCARGNSVFAGPGR